MRVLRWQLDSRILLHSLAPSPLCVAMLFIFASSACTCNSACVRAVDALFASLSENACLNPDPEGGMERLARTVEGLGVFGSEQGRCWDSLKHNWKMRMPYETLAYCIRSCS